MEVSTATLLRTFRMPEMLESHMLMSICSHAEENQQALKQMKWSINFKALTTEWSGLMSRPTLPADAHSHPTQDHQTVSSLLTLSTPSSQEARKSESTQATTCGRALWELLVHAQVSQVSISGMLTTMANKLSLTSQDSEDGRNQQSSNTSTTEASAVGTLTSTSIEIIPSLKLDIKHR